MHTRASPGAQSFGVVKQVWPKRFGCVVETLQICLYGARPLRILRRLAEL